MQYRLLELVIITIVASVVLIGKPVVTPKTVKVVEENITTVVLLDNGKTHNAVSVANEKGSSDLNSVGSYVDMSDKHKAPPKSKMMSSEEINRRFAKALSIAPEKPISFILYFNSHKMELIETSKTLLEDAIETMKKRSPCIVDIIGHTDTTGASQGNLKISLMRANYVKSLVNKSGVEVMAMNVKGFGEEDLHIPTADNVAEAQNRNVEVYIK